MTLDQKVTLLDADGGEHQIPLRSLICQRGENIAALLRELGLEMTFSDPSFEGILARMLQSAPRDVDRREGSILYDALACAALEFAQAGAERECAQALTYASLSAGRWLDLRVAEHGLTRIPASHAQKRGLFYADGEETLPAEVEGGGRFSCGGLIYTVRARLGPGEYVMRCESAGAAGNVPEGAMLPLDGQGNLAAAYLGGLLSPGEDEESDSALYARFVQAVNRPAFGGNRSDYENKFVSLEGVGGVKLLRATPAAGQVTAILLDAAGLPPDGALVSAVQEAVDPVHGEGIGLAPMCHEVHVQGAEGVTVDVEATVELSPTAVLEAVAAQARLVLEEYFASLRAAWADYDGGYLPLTVRAAQAEAAILGLREVVDISSLTLCGADGNLLLSQEEVPLLGEVVLHV